MTLQVTAETGDGIALILAALPRGQEVYALYKGWAVPATCRCDRLFGDAKNRDHISTVHGDVRQGPVRERLSIMRLGNTRIRPVGDKNHRQALLRRERRRLFPGEPTGHLPVH